MLPRFLAEEIEDTEIVGPLMHTDPNTVMKTGVRYVKFKSGEDPLRTGDEYAVTGEFGDFSLYCPIHSGPRIYGPDGRGFTLPKCSSVMDSCYLALGVIDVIKGWFKDD